MKKRILPNLNIPLLVALMLCVIISGQAQVVEVAKDIAPGAPPSSGYSFMATANGKVFISANDLDANWSPVHGQELWVSDGTEAGTQLLKDIYPGPTSSDAGWNNKFATCNNKLFFVAGCDGVATSTLWASDGTTDGTYSVLPDSLLYVSSSSGKLYAYNGKVYFKGKDKTTNAQFELFCSDGTTDGTYMVKNINDEYSSEPESFCEYNDLLYFVAEDGVQGVGGGHGGEIWVTDGTEEGTHLLKDIAGEEYSDWPEHLTVCGDLMFFSTEDGVHGIELWVTDGTEEGTRLVKDIYPGSSYGYPNSSYPNYLTNLNGILFFNAYTDGSYNLWKSDGTEEGTVNISESAGIHNPVNLKAYGDQLVFLAYNGNNTQNWEPYYWTEEDGVQMLKEINPSPTVGIDFNPKVNFLEGFVQYKDKLYFRAAIDGNESTIWQTDGTENGTIITPGQENFQYPNPVSPWVIQDFTFQIFNGSLYYPAGYANIPGIEPYKLTTAPMEVDTLTGGGDYCQGDEGLPVGLSGSEEGVTYTLYKDGVAQANTVEGTGSAITFGNQTAGTYTVVGSNVAGNLDMFGSAVVNAVTSIPVSVTIVSEYEEVCAGENITFTATPVNGGTYPDYLWYVNGAEFEGSATFTYFSWIPGEYEIYTKLTSSFSCADGVAESNHISLTINSRVTPEVSITASENPVYSADPVTFTPTPVNGGTPTYEWYVNDILMATGDTYTYMPINEDLVYTVMTSSIGCVTTPNATSNIIEMVVNNGIPAAYSVTGGGHYCQGTDGAAVGLSDSETGVLYTLFKDDVAQEPAIEGTGDPISFGDQLAGTYTVTGANSQHTTTMAGSAVNTEIETLPVSVTIQPESDPICANGPCTFNATVENGGNEPDYQWYVNNEPVVGNNFDWYSYVPIDGDEIYVEVSSSMECTTNNPAISAVDTIDVQPVIMNEVKLAEINTNVCQGDSVTLTALPVNSGEEPTFHWYLNDQSVGSNEPSFTFVPNDLDLVSIVVAPDPNLACVAYPGVENQEMFFVSEKVTPEVNITANANPVYPGSSVSFSASAVNGGDNPSFEWFVNSLPEGTGETFEYVPQNGDQVNAIMLSSYQCVTSQAVMSNIIQMEVTTEIPRISANPTGIGQSFTSGGGQASQTLSIGNIGAGSLVWNASIEYLSNKKPTQVPVGPAPAAFNASLAKAGVNANSEPPAVERETVTLHYDGNNNDGMGIEGGGSFYTAARYPSDITAQYSGYELGSVDVFINGTMNGASLMIWDAGTSASPGTLLVEQTFSGNGWINIELTEPLTISGNDIWVGYAIDHNAGAFPAGIDAGPANANGDWISTDGSSWAHMAELGFSYNWNIRANINSGTIYNWLSLDPVSGTVTGGSEQDVTVSFDVTGLDNFEDYSANIVLSSNDPQKPVLKIPVTMWLYVSVDELSGTTVQVYPNPAETQIFVRFDAVKAITGTITLMDSKGQTVIEQPFSEKADLNVGSYPPGVYFLRINTPSFSDVCKVIIK